MVSRADRHPKAMFEQGKGRRMNPPKPQKSNLWATHECDMSPHRYGTRLAKRDTTSLWGGHYIKMLKWHPSIFLKGYMLGKAGRWGLYVQDKPLGYSEDNNLATAFCVAARKHGIEVKMYDQTRGV